MKEIKVGDTAYIFTSWGLVKGTVVKERIDKFIHIPQYKLDIDIDKNNIGKKYEFWYCEENLHKYRFVAAFKEMVKPLIKF
jgi:hypothetical protein